MSADLGKLIFQFNAILLTTYHFKRKYNKPLKINKRGKTNIRNKEIRGSNS